MKAGAYAVRAVLLCCVGLCSGALAFASGSSHIAVAVRSSGRSTTALAGHGPEIPALRGRYSRTFEGLNGTAVLVLSSRPVNYRDSYGRWQPIDDRLVASGGSYVNRANAYMAVLPGHLSGPAGGAVSVGDRRYGVSFWLEGASGTASVSGELASYYSVLPDTDARLSAIPTGLEEILTLRGPGAPDRFSYRLTTRGGLSPRLGSRGDVLLVDRRGVARLRIPRPVAVDAKGRHGRASFALVESRGGWTLVLSVDRGWLLSGTRAYPVKVDPTTTTMEPEEMCSLSRAAPETSSCGTSTTASEAGTDLERGIMRFPAAALSQIPSDSEVSSVLLRSTVSGCKSSPTTATVYSVKTAWTNTVTWNKPIAGGPEWPGGTPYDTSGGVGTAEIECPASEGSLVAGVAPLVRDWIANKYGGFFSLGFSNVLGSGGQTQFTIKPATKPTLSITYMPITGERHAFQYDSWQLDDKMRLSVNVGTGDLHLVSEDFSLPGPGIAINEDHIYDSRRLSTPVDLSLGWKFSVGREVSCKCVSPVVWDAPDGSVVGFEGRGVLANGGTGPGVYALAGGVEAAYGARNERTEEPSVMYDQSGIRYLVPAYVPYSPEYFDRLHRTVKLSATTSTCPTAGPTLTITDWTATPALTLKTNCVGQGQVTTMEDATKRKWQYGYDTQGRLHAYTDPEGRITTYEYNTNNLLSKITTPAGNVTEIGYDPTFLGRVVSVTRKDSLGTVLAKTSYSYSQSGHSGPCQPGEFNTTETDPVGRVYQYCFDGRRRLTHFIDPNGHDRSATTYGVFSQVQTVQPATGQTGGTYTNTLDPSTGVSTAASTPTGATTGASYDTENNPYMPIETTDAQGNRIKMTYNQAGQLVSVEALKQGTANQPEQLHLNWSGTLESSVLGKSPNQQTTSYHYDPHKNPTEIVPPPPLSPTTMTYDALDRLATRKDGDGHEATYHYDNLDRVTEITYSDGSSIKYVYDADGNLKEAISPTGATINTYDGLDRLTSTTFGGQTVTEEYYADSQLKNITDAGGTVTYTYTKDGQLATISDPATRQLTNPATKSPSIIEFHWDTDSSGGFPHGNLTEIDYPLGSGEQSDTLRTVYTYDENDRVATIVSRSTTASVQSWKYSYVNTANGNQPTDLRQSVEGPGGQRTTYTYDYLNRLVIARTTTATGTQLYKYTYCYNGCGAQHPGSEEGFGNILQKVTQTGEAAPVTTDYHYNAANQLTSSTAGNYAYDAAGNMTSSPDYSMHFNVRDQLTELTLTGAAPLALGQQGTTNELLSTVGSTRLENSPLGIAASDNTYYTRTPEGMLIDSRGATGGEAKYYLADDKGSITRLYYQRGLFTSSVTYEPFGTPQGSPAPTIPTFGFDGGYQSFTSEAKTSYLVHFGERYYDPSTASWTQKDPVETPTNLADANGYGYASGDPINLEDPEGTCPLDRHVLPVVIARGHSVYWELCNSHGHHVGYIRWLARGTPYHVTDRPPSSGRPSVCTALGVGAHGMSVYYGGAGLAGAAAGPEVSGPLFIASGISGLFGVGFDLAHDFTGC